MDQRSLIVQNIVNVQGESLDVIPNPPSSLIRKKVGRPGESSPTSVAMIKCLMNKKGCCRPVGADDNTLFCHLKMPSHFIFARGLRLWVFLLKSSLKQSFVDGILSMMVPLEQDDKVTEILPELRHAIYNSDSYPSAHNEILHGEMKMLTRNFIDTFVIVGECKVTHKKLLIPFFVFESCASMGLSPIRFFDFCHQRVGLFADSERNCCLLYFSHLDDNSTYNLL